MSVYFENYSSCTSIYYPMNKFFTISFFILCFCLLLIWPTAGKGQCSGTLMTCCTGYQGVVNAGTSAWNTYPGCAASKHCPERVYVYMIDYNTKPGKEHKVIRGGVSLIK
jgi:hypothetical protein